VAGVFVGDLVSEASSSPDDHAGVEEEPLLWPGDADVVSPSVELTLVFGPSPEESSDPASADEPDGVELPCAFDDWLL
jgi:hypothetical protein